MNSERILLIIGIDNYHTPSFKPLVNAVYDVSRIRRVLVEKYGFTVFRELVDGAATKEKIDDALEDLGAFATQDDIVVIYFAGHGFIKEGSTLGFWVPCNISEERVGRFVSNDMIKEYIRQIPAKHILLISDSCFSGSLVEKVHGDSLPTELEELEKRASCWVFASGGIEKVSDGKKDEGSPFGRSCWEFLETNTAPAFKAGDLFEFVISKVKDSGYPQQVQAHPWLTEKHDGGQLIFRLVENSTQEEILQQKKAAGLPEYPPIDFYIPRTISSMDPEEKARFFFGQDRERRTLGELINDHRRIVLLGGAGSGKSMELFHLANSMKQADNPFIPVYQRFNTYIDKDIEAFLPIGWQKLNHDRTVVFLDGLDEVQPQHFNTAIRRIVSFVQRYPRIRVIVSCRTNFFNLPEGDMPGTLEGFNVYQINDITLPEINGYVEQHYKMDGEQFTQSILTASLEDLARKPFFLAILIKHFKDKGRFAASRSEIMEEALLTQFADNRKHYATTTQGRMSKNDIFAQLEKAAYVMEVMGRNYLTSVEMATVFPDPDQLERVKFLPALTFDELKAEWTFDHNNIQEYLAARVLTRLTSPELLQLISIPGGSKIKPYWVNTLSFYVSIGDKKQVDELMNWMSAFDPQVIVRFEPERVAQAVRIKVVKEIIEFYNHQQIWISSANKFSLRDLARFGATGEIIDFLLDLLSLKDQTYVARINIIAVLEFMDRLALQPHVERCRDIIIEQLNWEKADPPFIHAVLHAAGSLRLIGGDEKLASLVNRYKKHTNEYIRAGLYKVITNGHAVDDYLDVFLEGMNLPNIKEAEQDRSNVTLMDEGYWLSEGLKKVHSVDGITRVVQFFSDRRARRSIYIEDFKEVFKAIVQTVLRYHLEDSSLFDPILGLFKTASLIQDNTLATIIAPYFRAGGKGWRACQDIWSDTELADFEKANLMAILVDDDIINKIISEHSKGLLSNEQVLELSTWLTDRSQLIPGGITVIDKILEVTAGINKKLENASSPVDWPGIHQQWNQESFDLLFDPNQFYTEVLKVFEKLGTDTIDAEQLMTIRSQNYKLGSHHPHAVLLYLSNMTVLGHPVTKEFMKKSLQGKGFDYYRGSEIHRYLQSGNSFTIQLNEDQERFIGEWAARYAAEADLPKLIREGHEIVAILWAFLKHPKVTLPEEKILDFTLYHDFSRQREFDQPAVIEQLHSLGNPLRINERVLSNLQTTDIAVLSWLDNAAYAIRHHIGDAVPLIENYLLTIQYPDYKGETLMNFYWDFTGDSKLLKNVAEAAVSSQLRQTAIRALLNSPDDRDFLVTFLQKLIKDQQEPMQLRLFAGNMLMYLNDVTGLNFVSSHIINEADPDADYGHMINQAFHLTDVSALQPLVALLNISRQPAFQSHLNFFESEIHKAIFNIGVQSRDHFLAVKDVLEQLIEQYKGQQPNLNFMKVNIIRMEEQLLQQQARAETLEQALIGYKEIATKYPLN